MRLRAKHLAAMAEAMALEAFEKPMMVHLRTFAPGSAKAIGDQGLRATIRLGVERARAYGVTNPGLLRYYVELMFSLGSHFDTDPLLPWAAAVLGDRTVPDQAARIARLFESTQGYLQAIGRVEGQVALPMLRSLEQSRLFDVSTADRGPEEHVIGALHAIDPQRCAAVGEEPLRQLIRHSSAVAAQHRLETSRGTPLVAGMMFMLGHGFAEDPVYPWIRATLREAPGEEPARRVDLLSRRTLDFIDRLRAHCEERSDVLVDERV